MKIEDRIRLLKSQLEELNNELLKSDAEYNATLNTIEITKGIDLADEKNRTIVFKMMKESLAKELEFLRIKINMIRKISPETADFLDKQINNYESTIRDFLNTMMNPPKDMEIWQLLQVVKGFFEMMTHDKLHDLVNVSRNCIRDTLKRLEDAKLTD